MNLLLTNPNLQHIEFGLSSYNYNFLNLGILNGEIKRALYMARSVGPFSSLEDTRDRSWVWAFFLWVWGVLFVPPVNAQVVKKKTEKLI